MQSSTRQLLLVATLLLARAPSAHAQSARPNVAARTPQAKNTDTPARRAEQKTNREKARLSEQQRKAVTVLVETADDARRFDDLELSAHVQTLAADTLWDFDETAARAIFQRAWTAATQSDLAGENNRAQQTPAAAADSLNPEAREAVIAAVARRDRSLAEKFLRELNKSNDERGAGAESKTGFGRRSPGLLRAAARRLKVARELLDRGEYEAAAEMAAPAVAVGVSADLMRFVLNLRDHEPRLADALYLRLLTAVSADPEATPDDVLLLSTPVISPGLLVTFDPTGAPHFDVSGLSQGYEFTFDAGAGRAFYDVAAAVLLRQKIGNTTATSDNRHALYYTLTRLLPSFEHDAPRYVELLRARQTSVAAGMDARRLEFLSERIDIHRLGPLNATDPLADDVNAIARAANETERDRLRFQAVRRAVARQLWSRAREFIAAIGDEETRRAARSWLAAHQVTSVAESLEGTDDFADIERAATLARQTDVPPGVRVLALSRAASEAARLGNRARATELLAEALSFANQLEQGTEARVTALGFITATAATFDPARAWETLPAFISAADAFEEFESEMSLDFVVRVGEEEFRTNLLRDSFQLEDVFDKMTVFDFARALTEARTFKRLVPRARAALDVARTALCSPPTTARDAVRSGTPIKP